VSDYHSNKKVRKRITRQKEEPMIVYDQEITVLTKSGTGFVKSMGFGPQITWT
jgi:hypothetical protein